eukprot:488217-Lingulodinium_polyedra.AAC.1
MGGAEGYGSKRLLELSGFQVIWNRGPDSSTRRSCAFREGVGRRRRVLLTLFLATGCCACR